MIEKALLTDGKRFAKDKQIKAKRPSEYWLLFMKRYVFSYKQPWFKLYYLVFLIPILVVISLLLFQVNSSSIFPLAFVSLMLTIIAFGILKLYSKQAFVPITAFQELARFIISVKGDVYRNLINLQLNTTHIESNLNVLDPRKLGLKPFKGVKYRPFETERFKANFTLNDGSICLVSLNQITLRVTTKKRRSSGKTKTKMKRKHKFFYQLALKLKTSDYQINTPNKGFEFSNINTDFDVSVKCHDDFCWVKVKSKEKILDVPSKLDKSSQHRDSIYTKMMQYLITNKVMTYRGTTKSIKS